MADPKSQGEKQRDESQEHFEQCTEITDLVSKQNSITVGSIISRHLGVCVCVWGGGGGEGAVGECGDIKLIYFKSPQYVTAIVTSASLFILWKT